MTIDPDTIKAGDTVRVRYQSPAMIRQGIEPVEIATKAYLAAGGSLFAAGHVLDDCDTGITILEHTPARPDWADALVVQDCYGGAWVQVDGGDWLPALGGLTHEETEPAHLLGEHRGPITVVLDGDGNPPAPEPEWLDADALNNLPVGTAVVTKYGRSCIFGGLYWYMPQSGRPGLPHRSSEIAPARVLWTPEDPS